MVYQLLIKWRGWPPELATWEDEDKVCHQLPADTACGQAAFHGGKNVTGLQEQGPNEHVKTNHPGPKKQEA